MVLRGRFIRKQADRWSRAIGDPHVEVPVAVPIDNGQTTAIIGVIQTTDRGNRCEAWPAGVEKKTMWFVAAEGMSVLD